MLLGLAACVSSAPTVRDIMNQPRFRNRKIGNTADTINGIIEGFFGGMHVALYIEATPGCITATEDIVAGIEGAIEQGIAKNGTFGFNDYLLITGQIANFPTWARGCYVFGNESIAAAKKHFNSFPDWKSFMTAFVGNIVSRALNIQPLIDAYNTTYSTKNWTGFAECIGKTIRYIVFFSSPPPLMHEGIEMAVDALDYHLQDTYNETGRDPYLFFIDFLSSFV